MKVTDSTSRGAALLRTTTWAAVCMTMALTTLATGTLVAQSALSQLGLTERAARTFVLNEIKSPAQDRRSEIATAGTRAFLKLPASARGAAATALFAWAKAYVNSPAFTASYGSYRKGTVPQTRQDSLTVEEAVKQEMDEQRAGMEEMRKNLAASGLPPAEQEKILAAWKDAEAQATTPEALAARRRALEAERAEARQSAATLRETADYQTPADPQTLFARRLREFLALTADVDFSAKTISLTGGPDGIEFIDKADRQRHWIWQQAAIVGPEATAAARAAAGAWLKEIER